jgi:hypothetical protein
VTGNDLLNQMYQAASVNGNASTLDTLDVSVSLHLLCMLMLGSLHKLCRTPSAVCAGAVWCILRKRSLAGVYGQHHLSKSASRSVP